jgi:hypothetical protein
VTFHRAGVIGSAVKSLRPRVRGDHPHSTPRASPGLLLSDAAVRRLTARARLRPCHNCTTGTPSLTVASAGNRHATR